MRFTAVSLLLLVAVCSTQQSNAFAGVQQPQRSSWSTTTTTSLNGKRVKFQDDGGIMMELFSPIPKKNPSPESMLPRVKAAEFAPENDMMMKEANGSILPTTQGKLMSIPKETAEKIQTSGQKFAKTKSDGGIMYQAALKKPTTVKNTAKEPTDEDNVLESSPTGAQAASGRGRLLIPSTVEKGDKVMVWKQREIDFLPAGSG